VTGQSRHNLAKGIYITNQLQEAKADDAFDFVALSQKKSSATELQKMVANENFFILPKGISPKEQSKRIDRILGYRIGRIEQKHLQSYCAYYRPAADERKKHFEGTQTWIGLHPQVLQTPYSEIWHFLNILRPYNPKTIVDFGAAYGRIGIVMKGIFPQAEFIAYEIMETRAAEARRMWEHLQLDRCVMIQQNILEDEFAIPPADVYFMYDFSSPLDVRVILKKLLAKLKSDRFFLVARGSGIRSLIQLKFPQFWSVHGVIHHNDWSIYSSFCDLY